MTEFGTAGAAGHRRRSEAFSTVTLERPGRQDREEEGVRPAHAGPVLTLTV